MKRKTKSQREIAAKAALRQRVADIASGAAGYRFDAEDEFATADFLSRFVNALKDQLNTGDREYAFGLHCLQHFDNVDSTTDHLFECGFRA